MDGWSISIFTIHERIKHTSIEYTVTFKINGEVAGTATYTVEDTEIEAPAIPERAGYIGAWDSYELTLGDITVEAVYTEEEPSSELDSEESVEQGGESIEQGGESVEVGSSESVSKPASSGGCLGSVSGAGVMAIMSAFSAMLIFRKRRQD